uniref:Uncharacterized protein n=1 Tax=Kitasatospora sp. CMC57 TaxID=3231513 RepID=A0AB33K3M6_9ACTN
MSRCDVSRSPCRGSQTSGSDTTPFGEEFLILRCRLAHSPYFYGVKGACAFEKKGHGPFWSHNHTQCPPNACETDATPVSKVVPVDLKRGRFL